MPPVLCRISSASHQCLLGADCSAAPNHNQCAGIRACPTSVHILPTLSTGWPTSLLQKLGLSALADKWPSTVLPLGTPVGKLTAAAAAHLGLAEGTLVAQGGADAFVGMLGLGVVEDGQLALLTGACILWLGSWVDV